MKSMYKFIAILAAMAFTASCTNLTAFAVGVNDVIEEQTEMTLYTTDYLRIREEPSLEAKIIDVYAPGTAITAVDVSNRYNGWIKMKYGTHEYFMHSDWLTMQVPEKDTEDETVTETSNDNVVEVSADEIPEQESHVEEESSEESEEIVGDTTEYSDDYEDDNAVDYTYTEDTDELGYPSYMLYSPDYFKENGVIEYDGYYFTYYSELVMPGEGLYIPGRWTDEYGFVRDGNGNLCLASNTPETMDRFSTVYTPWGLGVIYDYGTGNDAVIDVYVGW